MDMKSTAASTAIFVYCFFMVATAHGKSTSAYNSTKTEILPLAKQYFEEGKLPEAKNLLDTMLSLEPYNAEAHLLLGKVFLAKKKYENACLELGQAERLAAKDEIASQANQLMEKIPQKFKQPQPRGCMARMEEGTDPGNGASYALRQPVTFLLFGAKWQNQFKSLTSTLNRFAAGTGVNVAVKTIVLGEPGTQPVFDLFSVSELPAIVALDKHSDFAGAATGKISDIQLQALLKAASK
jgi:thioredoxin-like negative regulator of GroEL